MAQLESTKNLFASPTPLVVGVISSSQILGQFSQTDVLCDECDVIELRLDMIDLPAAELHAQASHFSLPLLITARHPDEGGHGALDAARRASLLEAHLDLADII